MKEEGRTIGELVRPRSEKAIPKEFPHLPYVGLEHVEAHTTRLLGSAPAEGMRSTAKRFYSGDVLYSRLRPYLNKVWRADRDGLCSSEFIVMPENDAVDTNFLRYRLNAADFVSFANSLNAGDRPRVDFDQISSFILPPFSLSEQRAAVAEIDKHFTRLDAGVAALCRVQVDLRRYRAAVLKAACEGRLVPTEAELAKAEGRTYETGEQLLARILADRRKNWHGRGKYKEPAAPDNTNLPLLPNGWAWATCAQIGEAITGFTPPKSSPEFFGGDVPFFKPTDLDAGYNVREFRDSLTETGAQHGRVLPPLSILVTCIGATIGKAGLARVRCTTNQQINALVVPDKFVSPKYVYWYFCGPFGQRQILDNASATTLPILNKSRFEALPIPLPPFPEQERIVAEVERRLSVIEELEAAVAANLQRAPRLRQSILQRAFNAKQ